MKKRIIFLFATKQKIKITRKSKRYFIMNFLISLLLIPFEIAAVFGLNVNSKIYSLYPNNGKNLKFSPNFESMFLSESQKNKSPYIQFS